MDRVALRESDDRRTKNSPRPDVGSASVVGFPLAQSGGII